MSKFLAIFLAAEMFVNSLSGMAGHLSEFKDWELDPQPEVEVIEEIIEEPEIIEEEPEEAVVEDSEPEPEIIEEEPGPVEVYSGAYGRLHIPDAGISVALYAGHDQAITDAWDSANIFVHGNYYGQTIADHSNQEFANLYSVSIGTTGYIQLSDGSIINIQCVDVFDGNNIGKLIVDEDGVSAHGRTDYMMYTCRDSWQNVRIWLWSII